MGHRELSRPGAGVRGPEDAFGATDSYLGFREMITEALPRRGYCGANDHPLSCRIAAVTEQSGESSRAENPLLWGNQQEGRGGIFVKVTNLPALMRPT